MFGISSIEYRVELNGLLIITSNRVGSAYIVGIWITASKLIANSLIALSWQPPNLKGDSGRGIYKDFARSAEE